MTNTRSATLRQKTSPTVQDITNARINNVIRRLRQKSFYMGDDSTPRKLLWQRSTSGSNIVIDKLKSTVNIRINAPPGSDPGNVDSPPAHLSAVVVLTHEDFRLSPDGYWKEPVDSAPSLADVIISCTGATPTGCRVQYYSS